MQYMVQKASYGNLSKVTYYRKQTSQHPSHQESGQFSEDVKRNYSKTNSIPLDDVELGKYMSNQNIPTGNNTLEI